MQFSRDYFAIQYFLLKKLLVPDRNEIETVGRRRFFVSRPRRIAQYGLHDGKIFEEPLAAVLRETASRVRPVLLLAFADFHQRCRHKNL